MTHLDRLLAGGTAFDEAVGAAAAARIFTSPFFLYRIERDGPRSRLK